MHYYLDFERPVAELENKIEELKRLADGKDMNINSELKKLEKKAKDLRVDIFSKITPWQKTLIARHPEGYRKALRVMKLAERFGNPIFTFIDTPGAYPGIGAEERGQAEAIANNLKVIARLRTPIVTVVIGEGGSGGRRGIG